MSLISEQIELEKKMTQLSIDNYRSELQIAKTKENFANTKVASQILSRILESYVTSIQQYSSAAACGKAVAYSTIASKVIKRLDVDSVAMIAAKVILNRINTLCSIQSVYKAIGQALEDEYKMRTFKNENSSYYNSIQNDLKQKGAKANRQKNITMGVFNKRLSFHLDQWSVTEKIHAGIVLVNLFEQATGLITFEYVYKKNKTLKYIVASEELAKWIEDLNLKLEVLNPFFLPMICPPKDWVGLLEGGYISPYLKKNKLIKNNDKEYLELLQTARMPKVYDAINYIQSTSWKINTEVLAVVRKLWEEGRAIAELPDREDEELIPYPYPEKDTKTDAFTEEEKDIIKRWKRDTYEIHKRNVQKRSIRILVSQIIQIAEQFKNYEKIWFPYQMDFRGRIYPIPVLLQPQGSDLAKGLLTFAEGKPCDKNSIKWLQIHGANVYGYDKESYERRIEFIKGIEREIQQYADSPLEHRGWSQADKPFQFLAFCFEYSKYLNDNDNFITYIPVQLDGTCNGLQHYSALLKDAEGGRAVNLVNTEKPSDIYSTVADKLKEKLNDVLENDTNNDNCLLAIHWNSLGINRKLTKRPVMVLPYGGTMISCREYITEYLLDNYSNKYLWEIFGVGDNPQDCVYKISVWLSKYLWQAITEVLQSAIIGMDYLRKLARIITKHKKYMEWITPCGLLVRQIYPTRKKKEIKTELYGKTYKTYLNIDDSSELDGNRQINGICPNVIHSLDAACLMLYLLKCKSAGIKSVMSVHDCYGTLAPDCNKSAQFLREAFIEIYRQPILEQITDDMLQVLDEKVENLDLPDLPEKGTLDIEEVMRSQYFFN